MDELEPVVTAKEGQEKALARALRSCQTVSTAEKVAKLLAVTKMNISFNANKNLSIRGRLVDLHTGTTQE